MNPELILFDEPSAGLDPVISSVIDELIISLTDNSNVTSVIVTAIDITQGTDAAGRAQDGEMFAGERVPDFGEAIAKMLDVVKPKIRS